MNLKISTIILLLTSVALANPARIAVHVSNGTADGSPVAGDILTLELYRGDQALADRRAPLDPKGAALFELSTTDADAFAIHCNHDGVGFRRGPFRFAPHQQDYHLDLTVYDASDDRSVLSAPMHHLIVRSVPGFLRIVEYFQLRNPSDRVVKPAQTDEQGRTIVLPVHLPPGYENFSVLSHFNPQALVFTDSGFYDTMSIAPGTYTVQFAYDVPITSETMTLEKPLSLPTGNAVLFVALPPAQAALSVPPDGTVKLGDGVDARYYRLGPRQPGESIKLELTGLEVPARRISPWLILSLAFAAILIFVAVRVLRTRPDPDQDQSL